MTTSSKHKKILPEDDFERIYQEHNNPDNIAKKNLKKKRESNIKLKNEDLGL